VSGDPGLRKDRLFSVAASAVAGGAAREVMGPMAGGARIVSGRRGVTALAAVGGGGGRLVAAVAIGAQLHRGRGAPGVARLLRLVAIEAGARLQRGLGMGPVAIEASLMDLYRLVALAAAVGSRGRLGGGERVTAGAVGDLGRMQDDLLVAMAAEARLAIGRDEAGRLHLVTDRARRRRGRGEVDPVKADGDDAGGAGRALSRRRRRRRGRAHGRIAGVTARAEQGRGSRGDRGPLHSPPR
jgi:hypothetical protein